MEMHRPVAGIWDVPAAGYVPALAAVAASFLAGGLAGCLVGAGSAVLFAGVLL